MLLMTALGLAATTWAGVDDQETIQKTYSPAQRLEVHNVFGSIRVTGTTGNTVEMTAKRRTQAKDAASLEEAKREVRLDVTTSPDLLKIYVDGPWRDQNRRRDRDRDYVVNYDFELQVPARTAVTLKTINGGSIHVKNVDGTFELSNVNGGITVVDAGAAGSATTVNGGIQLSFKQNPREGVRAKTVNGGITAEFPSALNADMRFKTLNGDVFTDFETTQLATAQAVPERQGGRYVYRSNRSFGARAGSGGPEFSFETLNGGIQICKRGQQ